MEYKPKSAIKGQVFADFFLEFPLEHEGDAMALAPTLPSQEDPELTTPSPWWTLNVDGAVNNEGA